MPVWLPCVQLQMRCGGGAFAPALPTCVSRESLSRALVCRCKDATPPLVKAGEIGCTALISNCYIYSTTKLNRCDKCVLGFKRNGNGSACIPCGDDGCSLYREDCRCEYECC